MAIRRCVPGQVYQGVDEEMHRTVNVGNWTTAPTGGSAVIKDKVGNVLTASNFQTGGVLGDDTVSIAGSLITTPCVVNLTAGSDYRVELKWLDGGEIKGCYFYITAET